MQGGDTKTKPLDTKLEQKKEQFDVLVEHAPMGIIAWRLSGPIVIANDSFCRLSGYAAARLKSMTLEDICLEQDWPDTRAHLQNVVAETAKKTHHTLRLRKNDGEPVTVKLYSAISHDAQGQPDLIIGQVEDLTEQLLLEKTLAEDRARLANIGRLSLLGELVGGIAHEISQPLTAISVYADSASRLLSANKLERLDEVLQKLGDQAQRAGAIMEQVQELASLESPGSQRHEVNRLVEESFPLIASEMRMHNIRVSFDLDESLPVVACDPAQVKQVILNLLRNSIDAIRLLGENTHAEIEIRTSEDEGGVVVSITDSGTGVSEALAKRVFEPFSPTRNAHMGFGLPICKSIVEAHDGRLDFYNNAGGGATFYFSLPAV